MEIGELGYHKTYYNKLIRVGHKVNIREGMDGCNIKKFFSHVPDGAKLNEISGDDEYVSFEFIEEVSENSDKTRDK